MSKIVAMGDFVKSTSHGHTGRVYKIEYTDDSWNDWLSLQSIPPTPEQIKGEWIGILINGHGAVSVPEDTCTIIPPIEDFYRQHKDSPFEEDNIRGSRNNIH